MKSDGIAEPRSSDSLAATPAAGEVHVWRIRLPEVDPRAAARRALAAILADYLGGPDAVAIAVGPGGKPRLAADPDRLSFNLAHSAGLALVAIAPGGTEVGVDVERVKPRRDLVRLAARWLPADAETIATAGAESREELFYAAWTRHEARVKCTGAGLAGEPPGPEVVAWALGIDQGYAAALALSGAAPSRGAPRILLRDASCRG
jgi:phosphopantetheinyl transferase